MSEESLRKFITENNIEYHWSEHNKREDVCILMYYFNLKDFEKLTSDNDYLDEEIEIRLKNGYYSVWMKEIIDNIGVNININNVFERSEG